MLSPSILTISSLTAFSCFLFFFFFLSSFLKSERSSFSCCSLSLLFFSYFFFSNFPFPFPPAFPFSVTVAAGISDCASFFPLEKFLLSLLKSSLSLLNPPLSENPLLSCLSLKFLVPFSLLSRLSLLSLF